MNQFHETTERTYTDVGLVGDVRDFTALKTIKIYDNRINMEASICVSNKYFKELMGEDKELFIQHLDELADRNFEKRLQENK